MIEQTKEEVAEAIIEDPGLWAEIIIDSKNRTEFLEISCALKDKELESKNANIQQLEQMVVNLQNGKGCT